MKRKMILSLLIVSLLLCMTGGVIYGLREIKVTNHLDTGVVDIHIEEYERGTNGREVLYTGEKIVLPGTNISKIPKVYNDGMDCYVRTAFSFSGVQGVDVSNIFGISEKWVLASDGYYYYTDIIPNGENIKIFDGFFIPEDALDEMQGDDFCLTVLVEAIQSRNFYPEFDAKEPWGDVLIQECIHEGPYDINYMVPKITSFEVVYEGDADKLMTNTDDFFINFPTMLPGDTYRDTVHLNNDSADKITMYFRTNYHEKTELLDQIQLKIWTDMNGKETVIYEGPLSSEELLNNITLIKMGKNKSGEMNFELKVPGHLDNSFSLEACDVQWIFSTVKELPPQESVKTGDFVNAGFIMLVLGVSLLTILSVFVIKREKTMKEEER